MFGSQAGELDLLAAQLGVNRRFAKDWNLRSVDCMCMVVDGRSGSPYTMLAGSSMTSLPVSSRHRYFFSPSSSSM